MNEFRVVERAGQDILGEGPIWSPEQGALFWVDILGRRLNRFALHSGAVSTWELPDMIGWVIERSNAPGFIAGFANGFAELQLEPLSIEPLLNPEPDRPDTRLNDAKADRRGRIWAGTMSMANRNEGSLYRFDPDHTVHRVDSGYTVANGPAMSPDESYLYHADSPLGVIYRFRKDPEGNLRDRVPFIQFKPGWGQPDGMTVDSEGGLWVAHWDGGRISRFLENGSLDRSVQLPTARITSCAFGGPDLERLFVTSASLGVEHEPYAGALFEIDPQIRGLPPNKTAA